MVTWLIPLFSPDKHGKLWGPSLWWWPIYAAHEQTLHHPFHKGSSQALLHRSLLGCSQSEHGTYCGATNWQTITVKMSVLIGSTIFKSGLYHMIAPLFTTPLLWIKFPTMWIYAPCMSIFQLCLCSLNDSNAEDSNTQLEINCIFLYGKKTLQISC